MSPHYNSHQKLKKKTHEKYDYTCQYCGRKMREDYEKYIRGQMTKKRLGLTVDHIIPISKGGKWELSNLLTACADCNVKKGNTVI